jgi:hypothetical protein
MEPFTAAVSLIVGTYAMLFGWKMFRCPSCPAPDAVVPTAEVAVVPTAEAAVDKVHMWYAQEACHIHERWSDANGIHAACFDLFTILHTDEASTMDIDLFAEVVEPLMEDNSPYVPSSSPTFLGANGLVIRVGKEKTSVIMRAWHYLKDNQKREYYTKFLKPLIDEQREASRLDCAAIPQCGAQLRGSGPMEKICGW